MLHNRRAKILFTLFISICLYSEFFAQSVSPNKEVIIIEKIIDENGNVISRNISRHNGNLSEKEIQDLIEGDYDQDENLFEKRGFGFFDDFGNQLNGQSKRPTLGLTLNFIKGQAEVTNVQVGSGAHKADIRKEDKLISINGIAISELQDIFNVVDKKSSGDMVRLIIFRDGTELEKNVELKSGTNGNFFFGFPEGSELKLFGDDESGFFFNADSLLSRFFERDGLEKFDFDELENFRSQKKDDSFLESSKRPSLGVFIDNDNEHVRIADVVKNSPADSANLKKGDTILSIDGETISDFNDLKKFMMSKRSGDTLTVEIDRNGKTKNVKVILD